MSSHKEVAQAWANKTGKKANGFNMFSYHLDDQAAVDTFFTHIYSYGYHFLIARHAKNAKDESCILLTTRGYSVSTAQHIAHVRNAIDRNDLVFNVDNVKAETKDDHKTNYGKIIINASRLLDKAKRARVHKDLYNRQATHLMKQANAYSKFFALGYKKIEFEESFLACL